MTFGSETRRDTPNIAQKLYQKIFISYDPHLQHFIKLGFLSE